MAVTDEDGIGCVEDVDGAQLLRTELEFPPPLFFKKLNVFANGTALNQVIDDYGVVNERWDNVFTC